MKHNLASFRSILKEIEKWHLIVTFQYAFCNVKVLKTGKMPKNISLKKFHKISKYPKYAQITFVS